MEKLKKVIVKYIKVVLIFDLYKTKKIEEEKTYYQLKSLSEKHAAYINSQLTEAAHLAELTAANAEIHPHSWRPTGSRQPILRYQ